ncbi:myelin regulatory factor-like protein isoform X3 [Daktulosphaira vitifoliae]|uniref:myelin regulatory factor-like protein isoform X3 n=1 Tax=Daktulosphaira vitifoliae TaxID=58002 RepID=UPI0021A9995A|nr:myelin regulatory factor-like protein isoform X3 [Daktulosphaira vitifoliae]
MEYTWTLLSNTDDQGLGNEATMLNCSASESHPGQILILSNESNTQNITNQSINDLTNSLDKDYSMNRLQNIESKKHHTLHNRSDFVGGIDHEALDFSNLADEFIQNSNHETNQFFQDPINQNEQVMIRINSPYQQQSQIFLKNSTMPTIVEMPFDGSNVSSSTSLLNKLTKEHKSHSFSSNRHSLPESPPDSEPPYSPADGVGQPPHRKTSNVQCLMSSNNKTQLSINSGSTPGLYTKQQTVVSKLPHPLAGQPLLMSHSNPSSQNTNLGFDHIPSNIRDVEIPEAEYAEIIINGNDKKRKLCTDIGSSIRVKKESDSSCKKTATHVSPSGQSVCSEDSYTYQDSCESGLYADNSFQCIRFQPFQESSWNTLCDHSLKELPIPHYRVDADKGFNFSNIDDAFVCQKKNHFQITCHTQLQGDAQFVRTAEGIHKVNSFQLHFYGVKVESPGQSIKVEQSQSDRSKKAFHPVLLDLRDEQVSKITVGRLHFSETTCNNMRKKGKPNPDQRYFYLVVGLHAHCIDERDYPIVSYASERIIVRVIQASNPGQFENDAELCWQRGSTPESIVHTGKVGINTDRPDEALVIHGNVKLTGHIIQPSDIRIKQHIHTCDTSEQLKNVQKINVVEFSYKPEFSSMFGLSVNKDTGIIAQEIQEVLPEAVTNAGGIELSNGDVCNDFLVVNKDRIFMENIGAVKELSKITSHLEARICKLEQKNKLRFLPKTNFSLNSPNIKVNKYSSKLDNNFEGFNKTLSLNEISAFCSENCIKFSIIILVIIMTSCIICMTSLFLTEHYNKNQILNNENIFLIKSHGKHTQKNRHYGELQRTIDVPKEIDNFLDKNKRTSCLILKSPVNSYQNCEISKMKTLTYETALKNLNERRMMGNSLINFIITIERMLDVVYKEVIITVFFNNGTNYSMEVENRTDTCGINKIQHCGDKSKLIYSFQLPAFKSSGGFFIHISYRINNSKLNSCTSSMIASLSCTSNPHSRLMTINGTHWTPSSNTQLWPLDKFYTLKSSTKLAITLRYEHIDRAICDYSNGTQSIVEYNISLHKSCDGM